MVTPLVDDVVVEDVDVVEVSDLPFLRTHAFSHRSCLESYVQFFLTSVRLLYCHVFSNMLYPT